MKTANLLMRYLRFVTFTSAMGNAYYLLASFGLAMRGEDYIMKLPSCSKGAFLIGRVWAQNLFDLLISCK